MSDDSVQSFKKASFLKILEIDVINKWVSSKHFKLKCCPEVVFNISVQRTSNDTFDVKFIKFSIKPATALIEFSTGTHLNRKYITNWTDDVIFDNLLILVEDDVCPKDDDYLNIHCKRSSKVYHKYGIQISGHITWYGFNDDLLSARINKNMETYLKNVKFSDVKIRVKNNEEFPAHKLVLASNSSVFEKMLTTDMKESNKNCINLPELDSDTVNKLLHFLYHGKLDKASDDSSILLELARAADMYLISDLKRVCDALLSRLLSSENVLILLEISRTLNLPILRQQSLIFIANNVDVLFDKEM